jgi:hypothetical protein
MSTHNNVPNNQSTNVNPLQTFLNVALKLNGSRDAGEVIRPAAELFVDTFNAFCSGDKYTMPTDTQNQDTVNVQSTQNDEDPFITELNCKIEELRCKIEELPGGANFYKSVDTEMNRLLEDILQKKYQKLKVFLDKAPVLTSFESIVKSIKPNALLPENAKRQLCELLIIENQIYEYNEMHYVSKEINGAYEKEISNWLETNSDLYVLL